LIVQLKFNRGVTNFEKGVILMHNLQLLLIIKYLDYEFADIDTIIFPFSNTWEIITLAIYFTSRNIRA
jgi:DUF438 domain-containing protein